MNRPILPIVGMLLFVSTSVAAGPLEPRAAVASFQLADPQLVIELVAAEPDVASPVAVAWDADGRMYVAEMSDYPNSKTFGRIRRLEDPGDDGRYRKATVFADQLPFPNGVLPYRDGVLVTAAPNVWHLRDTQGAGRADDRRVVVTGFAEGNQQLRVNGLFWGLDNWIYGANGRSGGAVRLPDDPADKAVPIGRRDFRFRPGGPVEAVSGFSQFGLAHDDWGNRFPSWNTTPFRHVVLEERVLSRNPYLAAANGVADIADPADPGRVFAVSPPPATFNREPVTFFNASCGNHVYRGDALPEAYRGNLLVCEPLTNLVQRRRLEPHGSTFVARRVEPAKEFLASTDPWFHPVNVATGPDGALYVVDFYRRWVEHPGFVPEKLREQHDWREGSQHGRIWRIRPKDWQPRPAPRLSRESAAELVRHLDDPNGWRRDTAQRLLVERQDPAAVPALELLTQQAATPQGRIHALWTLHGLNALSDALLLRVLHKSPDAVRRHGLQLAEERLARSQALKQAVLMLVAQPASATALPEAVALGGLDDPQASEALGRLVEANLNDDWLRLAVLSGVGKGVWPFLQKLLARHPDWLATPGPEATRLLADAAAILGARRDQGELKELFRLLAGGAEERARYGQLALLSGLAAGLARSGAPLRTLPAAERLTGLFRFAQGVAYSENEPVAHRPRAIALLAEADPPLVGFKLPELLHAARPLPVQVAAARAVATIGDKGLARKVLDRWADYSTGGRRELQTALLGVPDLAGVLLDALEQGTIGVAELDPTAREALLRVPDAAAKRRAQALLQQLTAADRQAVVQRYQPALTLDGQAARGAELFTKHCATCHQVQGRGHRVGADLAGVGGRPKETLLTDLLDPSKEVAPDFLNYVVVTRRGQVLTGLIAAETATSVTLRRAEGVEETILRGEVQELRSTGKSLMPEGLEQVLTVQDVADLIAFLQRPGR